MKLTLATLSSVFLLTSINTPVHTQLECQADEAVFTKKDLPEIIEFLNRDSERNAAIFNCDGIQVAVLKKDNEYVLVFDLEISTDEIFGEKQNWTVEQAISAVHNPDDPEPMID